MNINDSYCTFYIGNQYYGVCVNQVQEVMVNHYITSMPLAPFAILGLMNIRGKIMPAISLKKVLGLQATENDSEMTIVVNHGGTEVGLVVERIGDILNLESEKIEATPDVLNARLKRFISGVYPLEEQLLLLLDVNRVVQDELCTRVNRDNTSSIMH